MQIREGAYYRTRGGAVVGPLTGVTWCNRTFGAGDLTWHENGSYVEGVVYDLDLISEVYVSDVLVHTLPAAAPAPETKTLRDELEEKAALAILSGYYANPSLGPSKDTLGDIWDVAKEFVEARKK